MILDFVRWLTWGQFANIAAIFRFLRDWAQWTFGLLDDVPLLPRAALRSLGFWLLLFYCSTLLLALYEERRIWLGANPRTANYMHGLWFRRAYPWWSPFEVDYSLIKPAFGRVSVWTHRHWFGRPPLAWFGWAWSLWALVQDASAAFVNALRYMGRSLWDLVTWVANGILWAVTSLFNVIFVVIWAVLKFYGHVVTVLYGFVVTVVNYIIELLPNQLQQGLSWIGSCVRGAVDRIVSFFLWLFDIYLTTFTHLYEMIPREFEAWRYKMKAVLTGEPLETIAALVPVGPTATGAAPTGGAPIEDVVRFAAAAELVEAALTGRDLLEDIVVVEV